MKQTNLNPVQQLVILPEIEWQRILKQLDRITELIVKRNVDEANSEWVESSTARKMLGVSLATWQNYRDTRKITFSQFGRRIWVKRSDIESFMQSNSIKAYEKRSN